MLHLHINEILIVVLLSLNEQNLYIDEALISGQNTSVNGRVIADILVGIIIPLLFLYRYIKRKITKQEIIFFIIGFFLGATLEFYTWIQGRSFFYVKMYWPLPWPTYYICHTFWDAGLYMAGYYLIGPILKKKKYLICTSFDIKELLVMVIWGATTALIGELSGNGVIWQYVPQPSNPVWFTLNEQTYTVFVEVFWIITPIFFYFICLMLNNKRII
jgi:hypothetical protein